MKKFVLLTQICSLLLVVSTGFSFLSCSLEKPVQLNDKSWKRITIRTDLTTLSNEVKVKVSERDNIPLYEITGSYYFGLTIQGYHEYRLQTINYGPKVYYVIGIIGDEIEGF